MRIVSLNVGKIETLEWEGRQVKTGFRKRSISGPVVLRGVNLAGDDQADRKVHGGPSKTLYVYPSEHYAFWKAELHSPTLPWGSFGENLTTSGWLETEAHVGDRVRIGTAELVVTQPRRPCYKLNIAFSRTDMIERFLRAGRSGFYLGPVREGEISAGDDIELLSRVPESPSIAQVVGSEESPT